MTVQEVIQDAEVVELTMRTLSKHTALIGLILTALASMHVSAEESAHGSPVPVIFETDMCLDIDDGMALAIVHALQDRHQAKLVAITVSIQDEWCAPYVDILNTFYGHPDIPIGTIRNGLTYRQVRRILDKRSSFSLDVTKKIEAFESFAELLVERKETDGSNAYPRHLVSASQAPEAVSLLRRTLVAQPDRGVVMIQVGHSANFVKLMESQPDVISSLNGRDLIKQKVKILSVMAGMFADIKWKGSVISKGHPDPNLMVDIPSAQKMFKEWPTPIVASGAEIGSAILFPGSSIEHDFSYVKNHPIAESYRDYCPVVIAWGGSSKGCPHDQSTADPTATLYALRPDGDYFSLSKPGRITVLADGGSRFDEDKSGSRYYLTVSDVQKVRAREAMIMLISQPPSALKH